MVKKRVNEVLGDKMDAFDEWLKSSAKNATVNMEQGLSFSFRRRGERGPHLLETIAHAFRSAGPVVASPHT